jgi:hypothetical protein
LLVLAALPAAGITLVERGRSTYSIVVTPSASPSEQRAAAELQYFLAEMSGARLPVVNSARGHSIILGGAEGEHLGPEGFVLRTSGRNLIISGGHERGTMYGVYTFLDQLGCRWFTREVSRIPKRSTITIPALNETHRPAFEYREPFFTEAWDKDWAARNRTNGDHTRLDASTGGKLQYYPFVHSFYQLLPPEKHFTEHPEYYSLIDGKRRTERGQLCLTNPEVVRLAIAQVEKWIAEHPDATIFSVSQNDWEGWCECDQCRRVEQEEGGQHSGPLLRFVNAIAKEIGKRHPGKLIDTLAYWYTENPPRNVRPAPNVRIRLCPIGICVAHSFTSCPRSAYFYRNLQAWSKITNQLYIWHYNTNFTHYLLPFPDFDELARDIPVYQNHGVVGLFMQGSYARGGGGEASELRAYLLARMLWNPKVDVQRTIDEFLQGVYGPAAPPIREYFELLHAQVRGPQGRHLWIFNVPDYSTDFVEKAQSIFSRAEALAPDDATRQHVRKARLPVEYYDFLRASRYELHNDSYSPVDITGLVTRARDLFARMRTFGIESLHERGTLDQDEKQLANVRSLPAIALENASWRVDVVPDLNARIVRMLDKQTGLDAARQLPPGDSGYPNAGGQLATAHSDYYGRAWTVQWAIESRRSDRVVLNGNCENGMRLSRVLELTASGLHTVTSATNASTRTASTALQVRMDFAPGDIDRASMEFPRISDQKVQQNFITSGEPPTDKVTWTGADRPAGEWRLLRGGADPIVVRFPNAQVERSYLNWTAKSRPGVALGLWSKEKTLSPGESVTLEVDYGR